MRIGGADSTAATLAIVFAMGETSRSLANFDNLNLTEPLESVQLTRKLVASFSADSSHLLLVDALMAEQRALTRLNYA